MSVAVIRRFLLRWCSYAAAAAGLRQSMHGLPHLCSSSLTGGGETHATKAPSLGVRLCLDCFIGGWGPSRAPMAGVMSVYSSPAAASAAPRGPYEALAWLAAAASGLPSAARMVSSLPCRIARRADDLSAGLYAHIAELLGVLTAAASPGAHPGIPITFPTDSCTSACMHTPCSATATGCQIASFMRSQMRTPCSLHAHCRTLATWGVPSTQTSVDWDRACTCAERLKKESARAAVGESLLMSQIARWPKLSSTANASLPGSQLRPAK